MEASKLTPNSAEWLAELERTDPGQAAHTRAIVAAAGSEEVCQVCGDAPARDFTLAARGFGRDSAATARGCRALVNVGGKPRKYRCWRPEIVIPSYVVLVGERASSRMAPGDSDDWAI